MNSPSYLVSTTYLKLIANQAAMIEMLDKETLESSRQWFERDYVSETEIEPFFESLAKAGLESWVLTFGDNLDSTTHGPLGFAILSAPDLKTSLEVFCDYSCIRTTAYEVTLVETSQRLSIKAVDKTGSELVGQWLLEAGVKAGQRLIESLMGHPLRENALIRFEHSKPPYADALSDYFQIPCEYDAEENSFSIPMSWGNIPSPLADSGAYFTNLAKCKELKHNITSKKDVVTIVRFRLEKFFNECLSGHEKPSALPTLQSLADELALSPRTLARRLSTQNSSYKQELELSRQKQGKHLLKNSHMRVADIAYYLGYQEPANFIRAFKQWFELTPTQWRRQSHSIQPQQNG